MMKAFIFLFLFFSIARAEPFIAKLKFGLDYSTWSIDCFYVLNIDKDVISFYAVSGSFEIKSNKMKTLPYFDTFIRQNHKCHDSISHLGIEKNHFHLQFTKDIDKEILTNFLNFIETPDSIATMIISDFETSFNNKTDTHLSDKHEYYLYDFIGRYAQILSRSTL